MKVEMKNYWLSPRLAAYYLGITEKTLGIWMHQSRMQRKLVGPAFKTFDVSGRQYRVYNRADLDAFIAGNYSDPVTGKRVEGTSHMTFSGTSPTAGGAKP